MSMNAVKSVRSLVKQAAFGLGVAAIMSMGWAAQNVRADELIAPFAATAQSYYTPDNRAPVTAIDGSGMTPNSPVTATSTAGTATGSAMWLSNGTKQTWITFDLGSVQTLTGFHLWNYNEFANNTSAYTGRGVKTAGIYTGTNLLANGSLYASAGAAWGTLVETMTFAQADGNTTYAGSDYTFAAPVTCRYIQLYVTDNYGFDAYTGISEIRFYTSSVHTYVIAGSSSSGAYAVSNRDLLQTAVSSTADALSIRTADNNEFSHGTTATLTDGTFGDAGANQGLCIAGGTVTYYLDTTLNTTGYGIAAIDTYSGWVNSGRADQNYTVSFRKAATGIFGDPITVRYVFEGGSPSDTHVRISDIHLTGVDAVRFDFSLPGQQNGGVGYKELDVIRDMGAGLSPTAVTAQSYYSGDDRAPIHAIDGSGMTPPNTVIGSATVGNNAMGATMWLSDGIEQTWITFDLGAVQPITGFHLWNYNENSLNNPAFFTQRGVKTAGLYVGDSLPANGSDYASAGPVWGTLIQNFTFDQADGSAAFAGADYAFAGPVTGRYIQLYVTENFSAVDPFTGISEILFYTAVAAVDVTRLSSGAKVIADSVTNNVRIIEGTGTPGTLVLGAATTIVNTLSVAATAGTATLDPAGQTLAVRSILLQPDAGGLTIGTGSNNGTLTSAGIAGMSVLFDTRSPNPVTVNSVIANGAAATSLTKIGAGTLILNGANTYSGGTTVNGGTLQLAGGTLADAPISIDSANLNLSGGTLGYAGEVLLGYLGGANTTVYISGNHVSDWLGARFCSGNVTVNIESGGTLRVDQLSNTGANGILRFAGGTLALGPRNPGLSSGDWIGAGNSVLIADAGAVIDTANGSATINRPLLQEGSSTGGLTKAGGNILTLTAPGTYAGATEVQGGTLKLAPPAALIYYDFDTANISGSTVVNLGTGGAAYNGVINGAPETGAAGKAGQSVTITGTGQGIVTANSVSLANGFTFVAWVKSSGPTNTSQRIINNSHETGGYLGTSGDNRFWPIIKGQMANISSQASDDTADWHHVALAWDGLNAILYYDGVALQTNTYPGVNTALNSKIGFGNNVIPNHEFWNGALDEAYVFDRALTATEVAGLKDMSWAGVNQLPVATALRLDNGATLDLDGVSQTVATLTLNGVLTRRGNCTWGAPGSGARYTSPQFTGSGVLRVLGPPSAGTLALIF